MKKTLLLNCFLFSFLLAVYTQNGERLLISGFVRDAANQEVLMGAKVSDLEKKTGSYTNKFGFFSFRIPQADQLCFWVSYVGYEKQKICLEEIPEAPLQIELIRILATDTLTISGRRDIVDDPQMGLVKMSPELIEKLPNLLGEADVLKALQLMPGIKMGSEGSSGLHVRGGSPDQNLILLDDVPLYYVSHLAGLFSLFDPEALNQVEVYKGAFPARFAGRNSSVVDLRMKEGNKSKRVSSFNISPISIKGHTEGPIKEGKASYFSSARLSNLYPVSLLASSFSGDDFKVGYYFYDLYFKSAYEVSEKDKVHLSLYGGEDNFFFNQNSGGIKSRVEQVWGNRLGSLRWNRIWGKRFFSNLSLARTQFFYDTRGKNTQKDEGEIIRESEMKLRTGISDWIAKADLDFYASEDQHIRFGANYYWHNFVPGALTLLDTGEVLSENINVELGNSERPTQEWNVYVEDELQLGTVLSFHLGLAYAGYKSENAIFHSFQPRASGRILINENISLKAGFAHMVQPLHLLSNSRLGLPTDVWVPATEKAVPQRSDQWSFGSFFKLGKFDLGIEAYFKSSRDLITYKEGSTLLNASSDWEEAIYTGGEGEGYGVEFLLEKKVGKTSGWLAYTFARQDIQFEEVNEGQAFPYNYERRHEISLVLLHKFSEKLSLSGLWNFSTGRPFTQASGFYDLRTYSPNWWRDVGFPPEFYQAEYYASRNNARFPNYHRLDISLAFTRKKAKYTRIFSLGLYNAYNQKNPFLYFYEESFSNTRELKKLTLFPVLPNLSYKIRF